MAERYHFNLGNWTLFLAPAVKTLYRDLCYLLELKGRQYFAAVCIKAKRRLRGGKWGGNAERKKKERNITKTGVCVDDLSVCIYAMRLFHMR